MPKIVLETTKGKITLELDAEKAPISTQNVLDYVNAQHYDGTVFHRVIDGFMIQGGGYDEELKKRPTRAPIKNEANNGLKNVRGSVAMARTPDPDSATSQFFINVVDNAFLDFKDETPEGWGYCVFGHVIEGMDVVDAIKAVETGAHGPFSKDCPQEPVRIESASVLEE
ncbi:MAG: peptidyl-prolyl cis-trans isomerase [Deltaproteobacteria bacterium]|nr:peptidyl-prolyl cis-trans isomerase [Deltaproteobacteria bacterium]